MPEPGVRSGDKAPVSTLLRPESWGPSLTYLLLRDYSMPYSNLVPFSGSFCRSIFFSFSFLKAYYWSFCSFFVTFVTREPISRSEFCDMKELALLSRLDVKVVLMTGASFLPAMKLPWVKLDCLESSMLKLGFWDLLEISSDYRYFLMPWFNRSRMLPYEGIIRSSLPDWLCFELFVWLIAPACIRRLVSMWP